MDVTNATSEIIIHNTSIMKNQLIRSLLPLLALGMFACKADVDIAHIDDPTVKLGFGAALPVGEVSAGLGDFIGDNIGEGFIVREDGVLCFSDSMNMQVGIDDVDMTGYFQPASASLVVGDLLPDWLPVGYGPLIGNGTPIIINCPIGLSLGGINQTGSDERIDSAIINMAQLNAMITAQNMPDMTFDKIESVEIFLPAEMKRAAGNVISVDLEGKNYGDQIPVIIDNFTLDLVKDPAQPLSTDNAIDSITLNLRFTLSLENGESIMIQRSSAFGFSFGISVFDYTAIFGYFNTSGLGNETMDISFSDMLPIWDRIGSFKVPFADPRIDLAVTTGIGAPLGIHIDKLTTTDRKTGTKASASFNGSPSTDLLFTNLVQPNDPLDKVTRNEFHLSKDPAEGHIDQLFAVEPEKLEFAYNVFINNDPAYPQMRLTKKTDALIETQISMPFEFNKGVNLAFTDTLKVNINEFSLDSLLKDVEVVDSIGVKVLKLIITAKNTLPFNIQLKLTPLDENGDLVMDMQPFTIAAPNEWDAAKGELVPGTNMNVINVTEDKLNNLSKVKTLLYTATICDTSLNEGMTELPQEAYPIALSKTGRFSFKIDIAANLDAYLRLAF